MSKSARAKIAQERLEWLLASEKGNVAMRMQRLDDWMQKATASEVRRHWRSHWGSLPKFAQRFEGDEGYRAERSSRARHSR